MAQQGYLDRVRGHATREPGRPALGVVRESGVDSWTYSAVWGAVCAGSRRLAEAGIGPGDRVAIVGETAPAWGVAELAAMHCGAIAVPLDSNHPDRVLRAILADSGAAGLLASASLADRARELVANDDDSPDANGCALFLFDELFDRERDTGEDTAPHSVASDHPRLLVYTSGTTGTPKGVILTENNLVTQLDAIFEVVPVGANDVMLSILPLSHVYSQIVNLLGPMYLGAAVRFAEEATPQAVRRALERGGVTAFGAVPQFFSLFRDRVIGEVHRRGAVAKRAHAGLCTLSRFVRRMTGKKIGRRLFPAIHRAFGGRLRWVVSGGSYFDPALAQQYEDWGFEMVAAYGLTESTAALTVTPPGAVDMATVGKPLPGMDVRIDKANNAGVGEIVARGPFVMTGYWNRPDATAEVIDPDGWLHTGDLGRFDANGNLVICGRAKEMIVLGSGKNVFPQELDDHYAGHPLILEVCVVGLPEAGGGEKLHAVIVPDLDEFRRQGISAIEDYVRFEVENLGLELPSYQRVRAYTIQNEPLPRTPSRKLKRFEVRDQVLAHQAARRDRGASLVAGKFVLDEDSRTLLETAPMRAVIEAGQLETRAEQPLHPDMNLEFDLGIDSLSRAEMIAHLAVSYGFDTDRMASALTPRDMAAVIETSGAVVAGGSTVAALPLARSWESRLDDPDADAEARERLRRTPWSTAVWYFTGTLWKITARLLFRLQVRGLENLPESRPYVLVGNHASHGDSFIASTALPTKVRRDVFFLGYTGWVEGGLKGILSRALHVIPVDTGRNLTRALQLGAAGVRSGRLLMIFPEGERTVDGHVREFKPGTAVLVRATRAPVVPFAIVGSFECWGRQHSRPQRGHVTVAFGPPIDCSRWCTDDEAADHARITAELEGCVAELLHANGGPAPVESAD